MKDEDKALTPAFPELSSVLESEYKSHNLPLALTWVQCNDCNGEILVGRRLSEDGEYLGAFKANDDHLVNFLITSTGYHLWKEHVAKMVLGSTSMSYCSDVTQFSIAEYPLVPFARQCKLSGWFTTSLRSSYTGGDVYLLEFFLPTSSKDNKDTLTTISAILGTMKANFRTCKLTSREELGEESSILVLDFQNGQRHDYVKKIGASLEFLKNGMDVLSAEQNEGNTTQQRKRKGTDVRVDISLDDIVRFSVLSIKDAPGGLQVSESTLKRVCSEHGIHRWPPRDINKLPLNKVGSSRPLNVEQQEGTSELSHLTWDLPSNQPQDPAFQEMETVTIKAKYLQYTMRFSLCLSLGIQELKQQVAKRLCPGAGNYFFGYEDEDGDLVKIGCDEDLHDCISFSKARGKNPVPIVILSPPEWGQ